MAGDKPNSKANRNQIKLNPRTQVWRFTGAVTSDSFLYNNVIPSGMNQDGHFIMLVEILPSFIGIIHYVDWAESFCGMERKNQS